MHSKIKLHFKRNLKIEDGWTFDSVKNYYMGNPCDSVEAVELVNRVSSTAKERRHTTRRVALMTTVAINKLFKFMHKRIEKYINFAIKIIHAIAVATLLFCLWLRIDKLYQLKHKHLELNAENLQHLGCKHHEIVIFFRKGNDNK